MSIQDGDRTERIVALVADVRRTQGSRAKRVAIFGLAFGWLAMVLGGLAGLSH